MSKLRMINVQAAIFTNEIISRPDMLYYKTLSAIDDIIDKTPEINNLPDEIPDEIPRVQGVSKDNRFQLNVSKNRIDFFMNFIKENENNENNYQHFKSRVKSISSQISNTININRIGIITTCVSLDEAMKDVFFDIYFKKINKENLTEATYRTNNIKEFNGIKTNNIIKISSGEVQSPIFNADCLLVQIDTNNKSLLSNKLQLEVILEHLLESSSPNSAEQLINGD